jgi:hypothetical protein
MRSMMRYANRHTAAPTASRTTPLVELYACNVVDWVPSSSNTIHGGDGQTCSVNHPAISYAFRRPVDGQAEHQARAIRRYASQIQALKWLLIRVIGCAVRAYELFRPLCTAEINSTEG